MPIIIDRRKNPGKKNLGNRQRFLERYKDQIKDAARKQIHKRSISDSSDQEIVINDGTGEPRFGHRNDTGEWDYILPGNQDYIPGDSINKPQGGAGGRGNKGGKGEEGDDSFQFLLSYDEYLDVIFDGLELPDLVKASSKSIESHQMRRAGYTTAGMPTNLNVERTAIAGLGRRIALRNPKISRIAELQDQLTNENDPEKKIAIEEEIAQLRRRANAIGWIDSVDLRYNNFTQQTRPVTQAVMICIMDVSFSMGEQEKIIAKKFFLLLHLFLKRHYKNIDVVFIRHHEKAEECDEETFFTSRASGGTVVSSAYETAKATIKSRYPASEWNLYVAQASDGDNYGSDNTVAQELLETIMDQIQFMAYVEIARVNHDLFMSHNTNLWDMLRKVQLLYPQISMQQLYQEADVIQVFRKFFEKGSK